MALRILLLVAAVVLAAAAVAVAWSLPVFLGFAAGVLFLAWWLTEEV